jgi:peroxiredoxin
MRPAATRCLITLAALSLMLVLLGGCSASPQTGNPTHSASPSGKPFELPGLRLATPTNADHLNYLGVPPGETFALADIRTRILLIEVFNFYCPHCQQEAPRVNHLYQTIENDPQLSGQIKIIGIGIGNTPYEISTFQQRFAIPFPLFADRSRVLSRHLEVRQTPTFIGWGYHNDGHIQPLLFAPGTIGDVESFLKRLVNDSGVDLSKAR